MDGQSCGTPKFGALAVFNAGNSPHLRSTLSSPRKLVQGIVTSRGGRRAAVADAERKRCERLWKHLIQHIPTLHIDRINQNFTWYQLDPVGRETTWCPTCGVINRQPKELPCWGHAPVAGGRWHSSETLGSHPGKSSLRFPAVGGSTAPWVGEHS